MRPRLRRGAVNQGHRILKLIAKTEGSSGLIKSRSRPHAAGKRLVEEPAVEKQIQWLIGSPDLNRPQDLFPPGTNASQSIPTLPRLAEAPKQTMDFFKRRRLAEQENDLLFAPGGELERTANGCTGIESSAHVTRTRFGFHGG